MTVKIKDLRGIRIEVVGQVWVRRWAGSVIIQARDKEGQNQAGAVRNIGRIKLIRL